MRKEPYNIKSILESLHDDVKSGKLSLQAAARELHLAGWTNYVDEEKTRQLLKLEQEEKA